MGIPRSYRNFCASELAFLRTITWRLFGDACSQRAMAQTREDRSRADSDSARYSRSISWIDRALQGRP